MNKKHYKLIATALKQTLESASEGSAEYWGVRRAIGAVRTALAELNENFDETKFLEACGVEQ